MNGIFSIYSIFDLNVFKEIASYMNKRVEQKREGKWL